MHIIYKNINEYGSIKELCKTCKDYQEYYILN